MPRYDASAHDPPAPVAEVSLRRSDGSTASPVVPGILLLIDTGADVTLLPRRGVERLARYDVPTTTEIEDSDLRATGVWRFA